MPRQWGDLQIVRPLAYDLAMSHALLIEAPTPDQVKAGRLAAGLLQPAAGALIGRTGQDWYRYESGRRAMDAAVWALFLLATDQHPAARVAKGARRSAPAP